MPPIRVNLWFFSLVIAWLVWRILEQNGGLSADQVERLLLIAVSAIAGVLTGLSQRD